MRIFIILVILCVSISAQTEYDRWGVAETSYEVKEPTGKSYNFDNSSIVMLGLSTLKNTYYFFISDLDGDNCPFSPSCSTFFVEAVKHTNPIKGALMFADRFTRDLNLFKNTSQYHLHSSGKFYDPVVNYDLDSETISFEPINKQK